MSVSIVFSAIFFLILALEIHSGIKRARKKGWQYAITRFTVILLSAVISVFVARAVAGAIASALYTALAENSLPQQITDIFRDLPSAPEVIVALVSMILAPVVFYPINAVIKIILRILSFPVRKLIGAVFSAAKNASAKKSASRAEAESEEEIPADERENGIPDGAFACEDGDALCEPAPATEITAGTDGNKFSEESPEESSNEISEENSPVGFEENPEQSPPDGTADEAAENKKPKKKAKKKRVRDASDRERIFGRVGIAFGVLTGVLTVFISFAPLMAGLGIIGMVEQTVSDSGIELPEEAAPVVEIVHDCTHNAAVTAVNAAGGKLMFGALTSFKVKDESITLYNEAELICGIANTALGIYGEDKTAEQKAEALGGILPLLDKSSIIPIIASEFLSGASGAWEAGETFCGIAMPVSEENPTHGIVLEAVALFKDSNAQTVREDVGTIIKIAAVVVRNDVIGNMPENPIDLLENKTLVSDLFFEVFENGRLRTLVNSLVNTGIEMMTGALNIPANLDGVYDSFIADIRAISVSDSAALETALDSVFRRYGIDITEESLSAVALSLAHDYGLSLCAASTEQIKAALANVSVNGADTVSLANLSSESGYRACTLLVTAEYVESVHGVSAADSRAEADALAEVFASLSDVTSVFSGAGADIASTVESFGKILDKLADCSTIGKKCVDSLVVALLQSDAVYDTVHMDKVSSTHFANSIIGGAKGGSYSSMMSGIANVIKTMTQTSTDGLDKGKIESVIASLTPETAAAMGHLISDSLVSNMGFGGGAASGVSGILTSVFDNIADAKNSGMDDATYAEESKKIAEIIDVTMTISNDSGGSVNIDSYVDSVLSSTIITDSLTEAVYKDGDEPTVDPLGTGMNLSENDKSSLVSKLQGSINDAPEGEEREKAKKDAVAIAAYLNLKVEIVGETVTVPDGGSN